MSKKVLHIITRMILGGAQENTLLSCEGLQSRGEWDVTLITGPPVGPEGELLQRALNGDVRTIVVPELCREPAPLRDLKSFLKILAHIREIRPDIVHTHSSKAGIIGRAAAHLARVPVTVHTIHGLPFHNNLPRRENLFYIMLERAAARCSDSIVCVADSMRKQALTAGVGRPGQYKVIYSGMDTEPFKHSGKQRAKWRAKLGLADTDIAVTKIARLFELKGHKFVIEAAPKIIESCPDVKFLFVGDGLLRPELEKKCRELGLSNHMIFTGLAAPSEIPGIVAATDILVHASLREGLPRVVVQALLGARPAVCFDADGAPEVVIDGVTGRLVPTGSVSGLENAVIELARNPEKAREMGMEGRSRFLTQFDTDTMVDELAKLYTALDISLRPG